MSPQGRPLAEWWKRAVAAVIDAIILIVPAAIIMSILGVGFASSAEIDPVTGELEDTGFIAGILLSTIIIAVIAVLYSVILNGNERGQTVGKMAMKIQVRDEATGGPIGYGKSFLRWLVTQALSSFTCGIGALLDILFPLWDPKRQTIHDKAASSLVIDLGQ